MIARRRALPADAEFFYATRKAAFLAYVEEVFGPWVDAEERPVADREFAEFPLEIVEEDATPIGYIAVVHEPDHWFLEEIALVPAAQNRGLGTALVRETMAAAQAAGMPLRLSCLDVNPAQRLYARLGFRFERLVDRRLKMVWP